MIITKKKSAEMWWIIFFGPLKSILLSITYLSNTSKTAVFKIISKYCAIQKVF